MGLGSEFGAQYLEFEVFFRLRCGTAPVLVLRAYCRVLSLGVGVSVSGRRVLATVLCGSTRGLTGFLHGFTWVLPKGHTGWP